MYNVWRTNLRMLGEAFIQASAFQVVQRQFVARKLLLVDHFAALRRHLDAALWFLRRIDNDQQQIRVRDALVQVGTVERKLIPSFVSYPMHLKAIPLAWYN